MCRRVNNCVAVAALLLGLGANLANAQDDKPAAEGGNGMGSGAGGPMMSMDTVYTPMGQIKGMAMTSRSARAYTAFMSIPYARTPMIFEPAEPPMRWTGVLDGTKPAPMCPQATSGDAPEFMGQVDCLYLTVNAPHEAIKRGQMGGPLYPVIVAIHEGEFLRGGGDMYGAQYFMDEDVVLVTFNYRLGALGFLSTGDGEILGNMGLKDQVLALKWVQANIQFFGGDPGRVTLYGEGAGAVSAQLHMLSPMSSGLFAHVIAHSGSALVPWAVSKNPYGTAMKFGMKLGCNGTNSRDLAMCLKSKDVKDIVMAQAMFYDWFKDPFVPFPPTVEVRPTMTGYVHPMDIVFLPEHPYALIRQGNFYKVPMMTGFNKDEGLMYHSETILANAKALEDLNKEWNMYAPMTLQYQDIIPNPHHRDYVSSQIKQFYFGDKMIGPETAMNLTELFTDRLYFHGVSNAAFNFAAYAPVYLFRFSFMGGMSMMKKVGVDGVKGVAHSDDLMYFYMLPNMPLAPGSPEEMFSKKVVKLWTSFAYAGKPVDSWMSMQQWMPVQPAEAMGGIPAHYYDLNKEFMPVMLPTNRMHFWSHLQDTDLRDELYFVPYRHNFTMFAPPPQYPYRRHF